MFNIRDTVKTSTVFLNPLHKHTMFIRRDCLPYNIDLQIFIATESVAFAVYKLAVVSFGSQRKFMTQNFPIFVVASSVCVGMLATKGGFLQY